MTAGAVAGDRPPARPEDRGWSTVWTRGEGCEHLARLLAEGAPVRVEGNLPEACMAARADLLVASKLTSFDLVPTVVPHNADLPAVGAVVAAVGSGPHSVLAARVASRAAAALGVGGSLVTASPGPAQDAEALAALEAIASLVPGFPYSLARTPSARALVDDLPEDALLVVGAPGGWWLQRQFFGPGRQLVVRAKAGAVVVRDAPRRCFHEASEPDTLGVGLQVADARHLALHPVMPVVSNGTLEGIVRRTAMAEAPGDATVAEVMEDAVFLRFDDPAEDAAELAAFLDGSPVPVVDAAGHLLGTIGPAL